MTQTTPTPSSVEAMREAFYAESIAANELHPGTQVVAIDSFLRAVARAEQFAENAKISTLTPDDGVTIPADYVLVPREPTQEMEAAGLGQPDQRGRIPSSRHPVALWSDMLSAAPKAPPVSQPEGVERLALEATKAVTATTKDAVAGLSRIMAIARSAGVVEPYSDLMAKPDVRLIVSHPRAEWRHLFEQSGKCTIPPAGWRCTRAPGHDGPCAAVAAPSGAREQGDGDRFANEAAAKALYDTWGNMPGWVPWVDGGNSNMQDRARREAKL